MTTQSMEALLKAGEVDQARTLAEEALRQNPDHRVALLTLAKLATLDGNWERAEQLLAHATQDGKSDADSLLLEAALAAQREDVQGARALYERIIQEAKPPRAEAHFGLGYLLASTEDYAGARKPLERAVELEPEVAPYRFHLARVLLALEELQAGLPHLQKALELNPLYPPVYVVWSEVLQAMGELQAAEELLRKGLELMPDQPQLLNLLSNVLAARGDVPGALSTAQQVASAHPDDPAALGNLARLMMATGHRQEALELCQEMSNNGLATAQTKRIEAMVLESQDPPDVGGAAAAYLAAMEMDPEDWASANNLGNLLMRQGDGQGPEYIGEAIEALEEAHQRAPSRIEPLLNLALIHARAGDKERSKTMAREVIKRSGEKDKDFREQAERLLKTLG